MKKAFVLWLFVMSITVTLAQKGPQTLTDPKKQNPMLVGETKRSHLQHKEFNEWFQKEYHDYKADSGMIALIKPLMKGVKTVLVMATWCSDSRREVPRFYKILDVGKLKEKHMRVYCVDRDKKAGSFSTTDLKIQLVPTFIFYKNGVELGRIVESPVESLEKDLLKILTGTKS